MVETVMMMYKCIRDLSLHRPFTKTKKGGAHLKELSEQNGGDFEPEEIFFGTTKAGIQKEYQGLASITEFIKTFLCEELLEIMVTKSNRYYQKIVQTKKSPSS